MSSTPQPSRRLQSRIKALSTRKRTTTLLHLPVTFGAGIGKDSKESIDKEFRRILKEVGDKGLSEKENHRLSKMLETHKDVFRETPFTSTLCPKRLGLSSETNDAFQTRTMPPTDPHMILVSSEVNDMEFTGSV